MSPGIVHVKIEMKVEMGNGKFKRVKWDLPIDASAGEMVTFSSLRPIQYVSFGKKKVKFKPLGVVTHNLQIIKTVKKEKA